MMQSPTMSLAITAVAGCASLFGMMLAFIVFSPENIAMINSVGWVIAVICLGIGYMQYQLVLKQK